MVCLLPRAPSHPWLLPTRSQHTTLCAPSLPARIQAWRPPLSHLQSSGPPPHLPSVAVTTLCGTLWQEQLPWGQLPGRCLWDDWAGAQAQQTEARPGCCNVHILLPPTTLSSLDQKSVLTHLPLARTSSSPAEEEKLTEILKELAQRFK